MKNKTILKCNNCGFDVDINNIIYKQLEEEVLLKHSYELEKNRQKYKDARDELALKEALIKQKEEKINEQIDKGTKLQLKQEKDKLEINIKYELENAYREQLNNKSSEIKELYKTKIENENLKREKDELELKIQADIEIKFNKKLQNEKERIQKISDENHHFKIKEKDELIEQMKRKLDDANRISEQGSMQIQGETSELAIEEWIAYKFKFDTVEEIKKGAFGADCIQIVNERDMHNCGVICYESKNAKTWSNEWIAKLKQDMLRVQADIGVLVSKVMPSGMDRMGLYQNIWVCSYEEFKGSVSLLRDSIIRVHKSKNNQENKTDKMSLLYAYLTGGEFNMQFNVVVDGFIKMQEELDKEKRSLQASWKRRQKIIDGVLDNTTAIYGSLEGIAGKNSIGSVKALEFDDGES